ncbi:MFS transporter, partial [Aspergillus campestris IBT 28561]
GVFLASIDETIAISTYSAIASQFHLMTESSWLLVAYSFGYCISLPVYGRLSDAYGCKRVIISAYGLFALGCLACGLSTSLFQLIMARVLSGISGAGMIILTAIILSGTFQELFMGSIVLWAPAKHIVPPEELALFRAYENTVFTMGRSLGAPLGGLLVDIISWRWLFLGQVPVVLVCVLFAANRLPSFKPKPEHQENHQPRSGLWSFDFAGLFSFAAAIMSLLFLLQDAGAPAKNSSGWTHVPALAFITFGVGFLLIEVFWASNPIIPVDLMLKSLGAYCLVQITLLIGRYSLNSSIVPYFVRVEDSSDFYGSMIYLISSLGIPVGSIIGGNVIKRTHRYKTMTVATVIGSVIFYLGVFILWRDGCPLWETSIMFPIGISMGLVFSSQFISMTCSSPKSRLAVCIGTYFVSQQLGILLGPAIGLALVQALFGASLGRDLPGSGDQAVLISNILDDVKYARSLPRALQEIVRSSYLFGFQFLPCEFLLLW